MKKIIVFLIAISLCSCMSKMQIRKFILPLLHKDYCDYDYSGEPNYRQFYISDTIIIDNPIVIYRNCNRYVTKLETLTTQSKINDSFFDRPDVFLFRFDFGNLNISGYNPKFFYGLNHCDLSDQLIYKNINYRVFKSNSVRFILGFISVNHYNTIYNAIDCNWIAIKSKKQKIEYYKILFPLCE